MRDNLRFNSTPAPHELATFVTPEPEVFVVHHLGIPEIPPSDWCFVVDGLVERPMEFDLSALAALPQVEVTAFHECAGSPLRPTAPVRRVANVVWSGVRLKTILELAGVRQEGRYVWATGADSGPYAPTGQPNDFYRKDLPLDKALADEVLVATALNGEPLSTRHGAPARLVVPGFYGTSSVKWLTELSVQASRAESYFTTTLYTETVTVDGIETKRPVWHVAPQSIIVAPAAGARLPEALVEISGWAWAASGITQVEVSTDGGRQWRPARLQPRVSQAWQRFSAVWNATAGTHRLASRATDASGLVQPLQGARNEVMQLEVVVA